MGRSTDIPHFIYSPVLGITSASAFRLQCNLPIIHVVYGLNF